MAGFTRSRDGRYRATIRVTHRVGREVLEASLVIKNGGLPQSRSRAMRELREDLAIYGDDGLIMKAKNRLPDLDDEVCRQDLDEARECVNALFPELRDQPGLAQVDGY